MNRSKNRIDTARIASGIYTQPLLAKMIKKLNQQKYLLISKKGVEVTKESYTEEVDPKTGSSL